MAKLCLAFIAIFILCQLIPEGDAVVVPQFVTNMVEDVKQKLLNSVRETLRQTVLDLRDFIQREIIDYTIKNLKEKLSDMMKPVALLKSIG